VLLDAVESAGFVPDGSVLALASYENRVYQIGTEDGFVVVKFYRPGRWSDAAILEEHAFALELAAQEVPVVPPLEHAGRTLHEHEGFRFALYERRGGRWPELAGRDDRLWLGRFLGRLHAVGGTRRFAARPALRVEALGDEPVQELLAGDWLPPHLVASYAAITAELLAAVRERFAAVGRYRELRIHGDCHRGNVLWTDDGPHFVDLDDCMSGPAVQDLWLFLAGNREEMTAQLGELLEGYTQFADFDFSELTLIEPLRALRMLHYAGWLARRWHDPAFPRAFPWFGEPRYWEEHVLALMEQRAALDELPLALSV
jgi:Ser/Thr protein kinase RdoA (MazF antagonist)